MVPPYSDRIPRVPPYSSSSQQVCFRVRDYHPVPSDFPDRSTNTQADSDSGLLPVRSPLLGGISVDFFSSGYLDVSVPPVRLVNLCIQLTIVCRNTLGFPIRTSPGQRFISPRRRFSQISTSFIASDCRGHPPCTLSRLTSQPEDVSFDSSSTCENLRDSNTHELCVVSIFSLIQIFKEQNFAVHLFRFTLKFSCVRSKRWWSYAGSNRRPPACKAGALPAEL